jgi:hypothetical protein
VTGEWEQHGITDWSRRDARGIALDFCRFYFMNESGAEAFRAWPEASR